jgi:type VI secretion system protein ImpI
MRLELRPEAKTDTRHPLWVMEHGKRTLGRSGECDWQINDDTRRISKQHCTIFREGKGFCLSDQSANGTFVDGKHLMEGETSPLTNGSIIDIRGRCFKVSIIGEVEEDMSDPIVSLPLSDESPTISSILSDIAPNGKTARGIMGERVAEEPWTQTPGSSTGKSPKSLSRNVGIGWSGPPQVNGSMPVLPDNWFEDEDYGSQLEHNNATRTVVTVAPPKGVREVSSDLDTSSRPAASTEFDALFAASSQPASERGEQASIPESQLLQTLAQTLARLEAASADCFATLGMTVDPAVRVPIPEAPDIINHIDQLVRNQRMLNEALERVVREATQKLDPRLVEARVDAEQPRLPFLRSRDYWARYRQQFEEAGHTISIKDFIRRAATGEPAAGPENFKGVSTQDEA